MKKYLLSLAALFISFITFAQDEEHSAEYKWGERNAVPVIIGVLVVIVLVVIWIVKRKKKTPPPSPPRP